jgi:outer membrane protein TolC
LAIEEARAGSAGILEPSTPQPLSRDGAILLALARNRSLSVEQYGPRIEAAAIDEALARFDPVVSATVSYGKSSFQRGVTDDRVGVQRNTTVDAEIRRTTPIGLETFLTGQMDRERQEGESEFLTDVSIGATLPLMRGHGRDANLVDLRQAENDTAASEAELRGFVLDLVADVELAYWDLALARETLAIREASLDLADQQLTLNKDLFEVGKALEADVLTAEAELASREADLADARAEVRSRTLGLLRLLSPDQPGHWGMEFLLEDEPEAAAVATDAAVSAALALGYRPELAQARLELANTELEVILTRNGLLPRLDAFGSYGRTATGTSFRKSSDAARNSESEGYEIGLEFEQALGRRAERARLRRAQFDRARADAAITNLEELLELEVREAVIEAERQWERLAATEKVVTGRRAQLDAARDQAVAGLLSTLDALQIQRDFVDAQVTAAATRIAYLQALTELYRAEGTLLARRGVGTVTASE